MMLALDSSVVAKLFLREEGSDDAIEMMSLCYSGRTGFLASELVLYEIGNVLWKHARRGTSGTTELLGEFLKLDIEYFHHDRKLAIDALNEAILHNITYYDAVHVCTARNNSARLVTEDRKLLDRCECPIDIGEALDMVRKGSNPSRQNHVTTNTML